jgi:flagellar biosynthesis/type III secretory pathway chaperone
MRFANQQSFERRQEQLVLLRELNHVLERSQQALLTTNLKEIHANTARQKALFMALNTVAPQTADADRQIGHPPSPERAATMQQEIAILQNRIRHAGLLYAALLRRARRTTDLLARALANTTTTYVPPQGQEMRR